MRALKAIVTCCVFAAGWHSWPAAAQQVIDRIAVKIEGDIILLSEVRDLAAYQQLVDGHAEPDAKLVSELIEQWMVNNEATGARFPSPAESEINREAAKIASQFPSPAAYQARLKELGITEQTVRRIVTEEIYMARYLDYKFRPVIRVDDAAIEAYYKQQLTPQLQAKNQPVPPLANVTEQIHEVLVQQGIDSRAATWFDETKARMKIEIEPVPGTPNPVPVASSGNSGGTGAANDSR